MTLGATLERIRDNRFLVMGRAGMDLYADPPGTRTEEARNFTAALGGSAANIAVSIVKLDGAASLVAAISDDAVGRFVLRELERYGVGTSYVCAVGGEARNSLAVVETRAENCQSVIYRNGAADFQLRAEMLVPVAYRDFGALIVTGTSLAVQPSRGATVLAISDARRAGLPVILDIDHRPYSWASAVEAAKTYRQAAAMCDIVIGNDIEFDVMADGGEGLALARQLADCSAEIVVYKMGENGAITFHGGQSFETGIFAVTTLKPTGAGDAFMGGFVTGLALGLDLRSALRRGSAAAAVVVTRVGCAPAMPTGAELESFIASHSGPA